MTSSQQILQLIHSFPCLRQKVGPSYKPNEFDPEKFARLFDGASSGEYHAMLFVLSVWTSQGTTPWGVFNLIDACATFDTANRFALLAWITAPYWP